MNTKSKTIDITSLKLDGPAQLRVSISKATVDNYAVHYSEALEAGTDAAAKALGPIEVYAIDGAMILTGGHHRVSAALQVGVTQLAARVTYGCTLADAVKAAAKSNAQHGLPLSNADKRNAVNRVLDVDPKLGAAKVAELVGCSHQLVKNIKQERAQGISNVEAKRAEAKAATELAADEADGFAHGHMAEASSTIPPPVDGFGEEMLNNRSKGRMRRNDAETEVVAIGRFIGSASKELTSQVVKKLEAMGEPGEAAEAVCRMILDNG